MSGKQIKARWKRGIAAGMAGGAILTAGLVAQGTAGATEDQPLIIGGRDATETYSFMASLRVDGDHYCGASLISPTWLVTAGHCAEGPEPAQVTARIGSTNRNKGGELAKISKIVVHPKFSLDPPRADIALMRLDHPVKARPVAIAAEPGPPGTRTRIIGWGDTCFNQNCAEPPVILQELDTKLVPAANCTTFNAGKELCTDSDKPNAMACHGDSGGPQLIGRPHNWKLIGATSRDGDTDPKCATGTGIWTDVTAYRPWITQTINQNS